MRKLGLIGGMSWVSTASYYTRINRIVQQRLGGFSSPHMLIESVNFSDYARLQSDDDWDAAAGLMIRSAKRLENSGATAVLICSKLSSIVCIQVSSGLSSMMMRSGSGRWWKP